MNIVSLRASRALWRRREKRRFRRWRRLVAEQGKDDLGRFNAYSSYTEARDKRRRRDKQIAKFRVTHISTSGLQMLKTREGMRLYAYPDSQNFATVGIGHLLHRSPVTSEDARKWGTKAHPGITEREALALLARDLEPFEKAVRGVLKGTRYASNQHAFDALVSLAFNIGVGGFKSSLAAKRIRAGETEAQIVEAILMWDQPPEIKGRRQTEAVQFRS